MQSDTGYINASAVVGSAEYNARGVYAFAKNKLCHSDIGGRINVLKELLELLAQIRLD